MKKQDLHGYVPAIATPFTARGEIMEDAFLQLLEFLLNRGASSVCIAGDNGESWALTPAERGRLVRLAKDAAGDRIPIIMGISAPTIAACTQYIKQARDNGADALLSMPPTYVLKSSEDELFARFDQINNSTDLPIILYNSPRRAGYSLTVAQTRALAERYHIIGIKESQRDFFYHSHLLHDLADEMSIMTGPCHYILPAFALGARGFIATGPEFTTLAPDQMMRIGTAAPDTTYRKTHHELTVIYQLLMGTATWPAAFKAALNIIGLPAGVPRDPVAPATPADIEKIKKIFHELGIISA
ncbi:MAG: dihydrodipicolinate synthase family protein [Pseudomonadota bacterium]